MRFGTEGVSASQTSKYIGPGVHQLKINKLTTEEASTGTLRVVFHVETPPVEEADFEPDESATDGGKVGRVRTIWLKYEAQLEEFNRNIAQIASALKVREQTDKIVASSLTEYVEELNDVITDKFAWFGVKGEEYIKQDGKTGIALLFRRFGFVADTQDDLEPHDKDNEYHYKPAEVPESDNVVDGESFYTA